MADFDTDDGPDGRTFVAEIDDDHVVTDQHGDIPDYWMSDEQIAYILNGGGVRNEREDYPDWTPVDEDEPVTVHVGRAAEECFLNAQEEIIAVMGRLEKLICKEGESLTSENIAEYYFGHESLLCTTMKRLLSIDNESYVVMKQYSL
jgi:hypothetical protein